MSGLTPKKSGGIDFSDLMMDALVFDPKSMKLCHTQVPRPTISADDDVIIKVAYAGVCGTDLHVVEGSFPVQNEPIILGHEMSGIVDSVGCIVKHIKKGDKVACDPQTMCGFCKQCKNGKIQHCPAGGLRAAVGFYRDGGWAQYCKLSVRQIYKLPESVSLQQGVLAEPLSCIVNGFRQISNLQIGEKVLIQGAGIIGFLFAAVLHHTGHRDVVVVEPSKARGTLFEKLSTGFTVVTPEVLQQQADGECAWDFDVVIDCSGNVRALELGSSLLRPSGRMVLFGVADPKAKMIIKPFDFMWKELGLVGCLINAYCFQPSIDLLAAMGSRYIGYKCLGIREYQLCEYKDALATLKNGEVSKAVFKFIEH